MQIKYIQVKQRFGSTKLSLFTGEGTGNEEAYKGKNKQKHVSKRRESNVCTKNNMKSILD